MTQTTEEIGTEEAASSAGTPQHEKVFDPYLYLVPMPFSRTFFPLGFPLQFSTNSEDIFAAAEESWGAFEQRFEMTPIQAQVGLLANGSLQCPGRMKHTAYGQLLNGIFDGENFFISDLKGGTSFAWAAPGAVANREYLRYYILEPIALTHIANRYSAPVHAACIARNGRGVMLCGASGAGKSTLAFACARAGWTYTSDDASYLVHGWSDSRAVGDCHKMRFRPSAAEIFSEVKGRPLTPRMRGKPSIEIPVSELAGIAAAPETRVDFMVFLNRKSGRQELTPFSREKARSYMLPDLIWEPELRRAQLTSIERILSLPVYELHYREFDWAIDRLERMVQEGS